MRRGQRRAALKLNILDLCMGGKSVQMNYSKTSLIWYAYTCAKCVECDLTKESLPESATLAPTLFRSDTHSWMCFEMATKRK